MVGAAADRPMKYQPSPQHPLGKRLMQISFKKLLLSSSFLGHLLVMEIRQGPGLHLKGRQRVCRVTTEQVYNCES